MLFLFGERVHSHSESVGDRPCPVCNATQPFCRVIETNYFCLFGLRLLPIEKIANYWRCENCRNSFVENDLAEPSQLPVVKQVLTYVMLGYGMHDHVEIPREICSKVTGFEFTPKEVRDLMRELSAGKSDIHTMLQSYAPAINTYGKRQIIEAAFLMTHASCEIQHEDRVRINLIGNSLGVSLEFVGAAIEHVRSQGYYGVRRLLPTQ